MMRFTAFMGAVLTCLVAASAAAGSFSVSPTRVEFDSSRRTASITLRNADPAAPLTLQVSLVGWDQDKGEDVYRDTRDLIATPPVFTIAPGGEQIVRLALRRGQDARTELPYRIFFQEVPRADAVNANMLNIALRIGVPVFVLPEKPDEGMYLRWQAARLPDGKLELSATNEGAVHVQVTGFDLLGGDGVTTRVAQPRYVLPGKRISWTVPASEGIDVAALRVDGQSDMGEFTAQVQHTPSSDSPVRVAAH